MLPPSHPVQIAYAVDDIHAAVARWSARGVGPFFVREHIPVENARIWGAAGVFDHSSAFAQWGALMVELICEHVQPGASPVGPSNGLHHMALFVDDFAEASAEFVERGYPEVLSAEADGMPFAFHDANHVMGHLVELYEATPRLREFYAKVAASVDRPDSPGSQFI